MTIRAPSAPSAASPRTLQRSRTASQAATNAATVNAEQAWAKTGETYM